MKLLSAVLATLALAAAPALAHTVGFQRLTIAAKNAGGDDKPIEIGVWYPSDTPARPTPLGGYTQDVAPNSAVAGQNLPLVVVSHGTGSWFGQHYDTALALARAGFVVAALSHTGDTFDDQSRAAHISGRPPQLRRLTDYMLTEWPDHARIDADRVGAFGFSAGGFTVLASVGGVPDLAKIAQVCAAHPDRFECGVVKRSGGPPAVLPDRSVWAPDARIKAAVVAAPALGYTFDLAAVTLPIQLWRAEDDHILPGLDYAEAVRKALPRPPEYHLVKGADHFDFLAPCNETQRKLAPEICEEIDGFDRTAFHVQFNRDLVAFFQRELR